MAVRCVRRLPRAWSLRLLGSEVPARCPAAICSTPSLVPWYTGSFTLMRGMVTYPMMPVPVTSSVSSYSRFCASVMCHRSPFAASRSLYACAAFEHGFAFGAGHVFGLFHVACYGVRLVHAVPPVAECRIRDEAQRADHGDCGDGNHHIEQRIRFLMLGSRFNLRTRFNLRIQFDLRSWLGVRFIRHVIYATPASAKPSWQRSAAPSPRPRWPRQSKRPAARRRRCAAGPAWWVACACW